MRLESIIGLALGAVMAGVLLAALFWALWTNRRRPAALEKLAAGLGMRYLHRDPAGDARRAEQFARFFPRSRRHEFSNVISGDFRDRRILAFDCHYVGERDPHLLSLAVTGCEAPMPRLCVRPEFHVDKVASTVGLDRAAGAEDIDFESGEFSRKYFVTCEDRRLAYAVIDPRMMEFLLANPGWCIEMLGPEAIIYNGGQFGAEALRAALEVLTGFLDLVPEHVWKDRARKAAGSRT